MALWLREDDVARLLRIDDVLAAVEDGFRALGEGRAVNTPRTRTITTSGTLHVMHAAVPDLGVMGLKSYGTTRRGSRFLAILHRLEDGEVTLIAEADRLGQMRTGAASGVATRHLAAPEAGSLGIIGAGWQARTQVEAICRVRPVALVKVYSRTARRREAFAEEMVAELGTEVVPVERPEEAVEGSAIVVTATNARAPVLEGRWLAPGTHVNAVGSNSAARQEIDVEAVRRADLIATDALDQARAECGDLIAAAREDPTIWDRVVELGAVVAGHRPGRVRADPITLFESQGIALEDVVTLELLDRKARAAGAGEEITLSREALRLRR
jgi:alanine dehydrogenase